MEVEQSLRNFERVVKLAWMLWKKKRFDHEVQAAFVQLAVNVKASDCHI
jgi:hypothetical protein